MRKKQALGLVAALIVSSACASMKSPQQLSPVGDIAYYAHYALDGVETLQKVAIDGEAAGVISRDDARAIVSATKAAALGAKDLSTALKAGLPEVEARDKAVAVIRTALSGLPQRLDGDTRKLVEPYVQAVLTVLTVFSAR